MILLNNFVGINPDPVKEKIGDLWIDTTWEPEKHAPRTGIVTKLTRLSFSMEKSTLTVDVPMELEKGDKVWFHYNFSLDKIADTEFICVRYDHIYAYERNGIVKPCSGHIIYTPVLEERHAFSYEDKYVDNIYRVEMVGCKVERYRYYYKKESIGLVGETDHGVDIEPGNHVLMLPDCNVPIENEIHQSLIPGHKHVYRGRRCNVLGLVEM